MHASVPEIEAVIRAQLDAQPAALVQRQCGMRCSFLAVCQSLPGCAAYRKLFPVPQPTKGDTQ